MNKVYDIFRIQHKVLRKARMFRKKCQVWMIFLCAICFTMTGCAQIPQKNYKEIVPECQGQTKEELVICRGLGWLVENPVDIQKDGFLELGEEVNLFYKLYLLSDNQRERNFFRSIIISKIDYLLNEQQLKLDYAGEVTGYLNFAKIIKKLGIKRPQYMEFVEKEVLPSPMTYPPSPTYAILNTALIEDMGQEPRVPFRNLLNQGMIARFTRQPELIPVGKAYASPDDIQNFYYDITHEIFAMSSFGDRDPMEFLLNDELQFLKRLIPQGVSTYLEKGELDILGELIICAKMIHFTDFQSFEEGLAFIRDAQKEDGSFGPIPRMVFLGRPNIYRHGVLVSLWALIE